MAEPTVYQVGKIETENGENADKLIEFQHRPDSTIFQGTSDALAPVMVQMGKVSPDLLQADIPYSFDDWARALASDRTILYRVNFRGQTVPKRWYEYGEDRQDIGIGILADYLVAPALNVVGYWLAGRDENEKDAKKFIHGVHITYPIDPKSEGEFLEHLNKHKQKKIPDTELLIEPKEVPEFRSVVYKLKKNKQTGKMEKVPDRMIVMESNYNLQNWPNPAYALEMGPVDLVRRTEIRHDFKGKND